MAEGFGSTSELLDWQIIGCIEVQCHFNSYGHIMLMTHMCFLTFLHQYQHKFLSKATDYFSQMPRQGSEAKIHQKEISPQPGLVLPTTRP